MDSNTVYCWNCGNALSHEDLYCSKCGANQQAAPPPNNSAVRPSWMDAPGTSKSQSQRYIKSELPPATPQETPGDEQTTDNSGCGKGCGTIIALIVIVSLISWAWDAISNSGQEMVPYTINIELNQGMTDQFVLRGSGCNLNDNYDVIIYQRDSGQSQVDRKSLGAGREVDGVFCQYRITGEVPRHRSYTVKVETHVGSGDPDILGTRITLPASSDRIDETIRWHHPRDN